VRLPFKSVVYIFKDETEPPASQGADVFETNLTRGGSPWRPRLTMDTLSAALAAELGARVTDSAEVREVIGGEYNYTEEESQGARLFVQGTVQEATWIRSLNGGGSYRLKMVLSGFLARKAPPGLMGFWGKNVEVEEPHSGRPGDDLARMVRKAMSDAAEDMGKALQKGPAAEALAQGG